ncbi:MAG: hypothetical protein AAF726_16950 [Planctomycetota bacterium]
MKIVERNHQASSRKRPAPVARIQPVQSDSKTDESMCGSFSPGHVQDVAFNVMPDAPVTERLEILRYDTGPDFIEAHFDREYSSAMEKSPSHLIFLSVLVQWQRLIYIHVCQKFGRDPFEPGAEHFKIWPTKAEIRLPALERDEKNLVQRAEFEELRDFGDGRYKLDSSTKAGPIQMTSQVIIFDTAVAPE